MHQSWPGVRRRRVSQPSIHLPRSVYLSAMKTAGSGLSRFSFSAKKSSLAATPRPPSRADGEIDQMSELAHDFSRRTLGRPPYTLLSRYTRRPRA